MGRALVITNHLRGLLNKPMAMGQKAGKLKPITLAELKQRPGEVAPEHSREAFEALMERIYEARRTGTRRMLG